MIDLDDVRRAAARLDGVAHRTPVITSRTLDARTGATVRLKPENLQRIGAFKFRGAYNTVAQLDRPRGVATASSGNHAQALALSAALHELPATILMPEDAPASKAAATEQYGARIVRFDRYGANREELLAELAEREGLAIVHPYDDERIMAGQGTATLELIEDGGELDLLLVPVGGGGLIAGSATAATGLCPDCRVIGVEPEAGDDTARSLAAGERVSVPVGTATLELIEDGGELDLLLVPVGGGGLISGSATAATGLCPGCRVVGVEPEAGDDVARSLAAGERVVVPVAPTIADGQQLDTPGARTWPVIRERVSAVVTVSDAEIVAAMRFAFERLKLVLEPSGASALAALLHAKVDAAGLRTGVILSGGNVDVARFRELTA